MLKVRIIAAILAVLLTLLTIYLIPIITHSYISFMDGLNSGQQLWFGISQAILGGLIAVYGFWRWKKKHNQPKD